LPSSTRLLPGVVAIVQKSLITRKKKHRSSLCMAHCQTVAMCSISLFDCVVLTFNYNPVVSDSRSVTGTGWCHSVIMV